MDDGIQVGARLRVGEDYPNQRATIQASVSGEHRVPETSNNRLQPLGPQRHHVPGQNVGVDRDGTQLFQFPGHRRLARRNPARQSDPHRNTGYYGISRKVSSEASPEISGPSLSLNAAFSGSARWALKASSSR